MTESVPLLAGQNQSCRRNKALITKNKKRLYKNYWFLNCILFNYFIFLFRKNFLKAEKEKLVNLLNK